jgi:hypothetical protein
MNFRLWHKPKTSDTKSSRPPTLVPKIAYNARKIHKNIDEAFSVMSVNSSIMHMLIHNSHFDKYQQTLQLFQNDFSMTTKAIILYRIIRLFTQSRSPSPDNVVIYTTIILSIIFLTDNSFSLAF